MKRLVSLFSAVVLVLAFCSVTFAGAEEGYSVRGEVVSIDPAGKTVVISTMQGEKTVALQETTEGAAALKPGMSVEMTCIDVEGKSCAKIIKPVESLPSRTMEGEVVSIDPAGKAVVIRTGEGEEVSMEMTAKTAVVVAPATEAETTEEMLVAEPMGVEEIKPGARVKVDCFDMGGKFCANKITVVSLEKAGEPVMTRMVEGEIVSIDPGNKSIVVDTSTGSQTLYFQKVTAGAPFDEMEMGGRVKAYCLDIEGKTCIKDITTAE